MNDIIRDRVKTISKQIDDLKNKISLKRTLYETEIAFNIDNRKMLNDLRQLELLLKINSEMLTTKKKKFILR